MSIQHAIDFMSQAQTDPEFRKACYKSKNRTELLAMLQEKGLSFNIDEFEDAVNNLLLHCSTESQAYRVREMESWFKLFPE
jgi:predicted ribosomally synthesized peptide with nif11-like leader